MEKTSVEILQLKLSELKNCSIDLVSYSGFLTINNKQNHKLRDRFIPSQKTVFLKNSLIPAKMIIWSFENSSGKKVKKIKSLLDFWF